MKRLLENFKDTTTYLGMKKKVEKMQENPAFKPMFYAIYLAVLGMMVTAVAFLGFNLTEPIIEANRVESINNNIALIYNPDEGYTRNEAQLDNAYQEKRKGYEAITAIYEVLDSDGNLHALVYNCTSQGRNGMVSALIAINPYTDEVEAVVYYDHSETPNIGEKYTREDEISKLLGQSVAVDVEVDVIANASTTWIAIEDMFNTIEKHYSEQEVHIDG